MQDKLLEHRTDLSSKPQLSDNVYNRISEILYNIAGIYLGDNEKELVKGRIFKRMSQLNILDYDEYMKIVENDYNEMYRMIDILTTNKTDFFREREHFEFLKNEIFPYFKNKRLVIWSAGCSNGKEPYSIAMEIDSYFDDKKEKKILATDISQRVINYAKNGEYSDDEMGGVNFEYIKKYFEFDKNKKIYKINQKIKNYVSFAVLNLMDNWPMKGPFDVIFCRNVMIYFDRYTQEKLVNRFYDILSYGGYLFIGHSESLHSINHNYRYIKPAIYKKEIKQ